MSLVNVSENSTFRVDDPETGRRAALRVSRPDYHSKAAIESELAWMDALHAAGVVDPAFPIAARDGSLVTTVDVEAGPPRHVVLFEWISGEEPSADGDLVPKFRLLGTIAADMQLHAMSWRRPPWFTRYTVDYEVALGPNALWGRWQDSLGMGRDELEILAQVDAEICRRLTAYGKGSERFGLAHSDLRLANLLIEGEHIRVIDFDDCGTTWYMYDFATAVSFIEDDPRVPELDGGMDRRLQVPQTALVRGRRDPPHARDVPPDASGGLGRVAPRIRRGGRGARRRLHGRHLRPGRRLSLREVPEVHGRQTLARRPYRHRHRRGAGASAAAS